MAILANAFQLKKSFGARPLFDGLSFSIESGERIGLIGPNGAGKSTLLRILAGHTTPDEGALTLQRGLRVGFLEQVPTFRKDSTVMSSALEGALHPDEWEAQSLAYEVLSKLSLSGESEIGPESLVSSLSGGWKKRVALARELVRQPDLLLLDEPTNHLDVESILWLEEFLARANFATLTITHDRLFLQRASNRIIEIDRRLPGGMMSVQGDYAQYLEVKEQLVAAQAQQEVRLRNTLRRETEWLRRGAKARTTKQQARIHRAEDLKQTVEDLGYRTQTSSVRIEFQGTEKSPKKLIDAKGISKSYGGREILPPQDLLITAGSRIGLLGTNGCGKSTLIRILIGTESSDTGTVQRADMLKVSYFEQNRESLDPKVSLLKTICPTGDHVDFRGSRVHVRSYLDRFLFDPGQAEMAVGKLSGGEQARLVIARLMLEEANLLVLDEPTNDLDVATLDVLEGVLKEFSGAVLLVTHDRFFLDQVATKILAFADTNGKKTIVPFTGLEQWEVWRENRLADKGSDKSGTTSSSASSVGSSTTSGAPKKKLSFKEQREWEEMESIIHGKEAELAALETESVAPHLQSNAKRLGELTAAMAALQGDIDRLYARWSELEGRQ